MFERSKASLNKLQASLDQAIVGVRTRTSQVRVEIERIDAGVMATIDRVRGKVESARSQVRAELAPVEARIAELESSGS